MNLVQGDWIRFTLPVWAGGSVRMLGRRRVTSGRAHVTGHETYAGQIESEWYDANQRHWFFPRSEEHTSNSRSEEHTSELQSQR